MSDGIRIVLHDGRPVVWRRPPVPRWCNRWAAFGLLLVTAAIVAAELAGHGRA